MQLDAKTVQIFPSGHLAQEWQTKVAGVAYADLFIPNTWCEIEKVMRGRKGKCPAVHDLLRVISDDGSYDVTCTIIRVNNGYVLEHRHGRRPAPLSQVLADLDGLTKVDAAEMKEHTTKLRGRWQSMGATREDLNAARRRFAQQNHPDTTAAANAPRLALANALIDAALESLGEAA